MHPDSYNMFDNGSYLRRRRRFKKSDLSIKGGRSIDHGHIHGSDTTAPLSPPLDISSPPPPPPLHHQQQHQQLQHHQQHQQAYEKSSAASYPGGGAYQSTPATRGSPYETGSPYNYYYYRQASARQTMQQQQEQQHQQQQHQHQLQTPLSAYGYPIGAVGEAGGTSASAPYMGTGSPGTDYPSQLAYYAAAAAAATAAASAYNPPANPSLPTLEHPSTCLDAPPATLDAGVSLDPALLVAHPASTSSSSALHHAPVVDNVHSARSSSGTSSPDSGRPGSVTPSHHVMPSALAPPPSHAHNQQWPNSAGGGGFAGVAGNHWPEYITQY